jgi:hypothetical protein
VQARFGSKPRVSAFGKKMSAFPKIVARGPACLGQI